MMMAFEATTADLVYCRVAYGITVASFDTANNDGLFLFFSCEV